MDLPTITSRQNQRVKDACQLRQHKWRISRQQFLIDGVREISRATLAGIRCQTVFVCDESGFVEPQILHLVQSLVESHVEVFRVNAGVFAKLAYGDRTEGIVAVAQSPQATIDSLCLPDEPLLAVIDGVEKPGNLGAILRTADAAGIDAVIHVDGRTDLYNPNTIRASLGTVFRKNVVSGTGESTLRLLANRGIQIITATPDAETALFDVKLRGAVAIVLGSEADGLSPIWQHATTLSVRLPMRGMADSLNVSATAAVLFYEALRQRMTR